jgi:hypothetical protein
MTFDADPIKRSDAPKVRRFFGRELRQLRELARFNNSMPANWRN